MVKNWNLIMLLSTALCAGATEYTWTGNGAAGNWNDAPNAGDTAKLTNAPAHVEGNGTILVMGDGSGLTLIFR